MTSITLPQVYRYSRLRHLVVLFFLLSFLGAGYAVLADASGAGRLADWVMWTALGAGLSLPLRWAIGSSRRLTLDADGVRDRLLGTEKIAWADVTGAFLRESRGLTCLFLELRDPDHYLARFSRWQRRLARSHRAVGNPPVALDLSGVRVDAPALLATVRQLAGLPQ